ncbi:MAG: nuclear transport factor 2 family protein [Ignavibacteriales bacterium]|nr:nuclear transport factor 2 family protein [Ignavibacteriales bacterium]
MPDPEGVFENNNIRYTGILEKKGSRWLIVQFHGSLPKLVN